MLKLTKVSYSRVDKPIFDQFDLSLTQGELVQIAGSNGIGKTTLLRLLVGLIPLESGSITWQGESIAALAGQYLSQCLYIGHQNGLKAEQTVLENLQFYLRLDRHPKEVDLTRVLQQLALASYANTLVGALSAGQKRRVALARLFLSERLIWVLDEPFTALDQVVITYIEQTIKAHCEAGGVVILTTHQRLQLSYAKHRIVNLDTVEQVR